MSKVSTVCCRPAINSEVGPPIAEKRTLVSATVLLVDDDSLIRRLVRDTLEPMGYSLSEARTLEEAVVKLDERCPDLVLADTRVLSSGTREFLSRVQEQHLLLILLTGVTPEDHPTENLLKFSGGRLEKPFAPQELAQLVEENLGPPTGPDSEDQEPLLAYAKQLDRVLQENRRKTADLRAAHRKLQEVERMKDIFLSLVSHELRTPLTIIKGNLHLLKRLLRDTEGIAGECVDSASQGTDRLERLIEELLSFSTVRAGPEGLEFQCWPFERWFKNLVGEFEPLARSRDITLKCECKVSDCTCEGDSQRLRQAFSHILKNAILFNRPGGKVEVHLEERDGNLLIQVQDNGPGIPQAEQEKVFTPFYQAQDVNTRNVEGLGLGLSIARHVLEAHRGLLKLESREEGGTRVTALLPRKPKGESPLPADPPSAPPETDLDQSQLLDYARDLYEQFDTEKTRRKHAEEQHLELEATFIKTLAALVPMVDPRPSEKSTQTDRILRYAGALAERLDPSLPKRKDFLYSLLLYDIGKIGVAESVLHKAGNLNEQERRSVEAHTEIGADLLQSIGYLGAAIDGVRSHHERWDGSGYPDGLRGNEIPLTARIIAVVDAFDAMTVDRPYRKALPVEEAFQQLKKEAGTHFDPQIVEAFLEAWESLK